MKKIEYVYSAAEMKRCPRIKDSWYRQRKGQALIVLFPLMVLLIALLLAYRPAATPAPVTVPNTAAMFQESCTQWSDCMNGTQTRRCIDSYGNKIEYSQACSVVVSYPMYGQSLCTPRWQCGFWSDCTIIGQRFRSCNDGCGNVRTEMEYCRDCILRCTWWSVCIKGLQSRTCGDTWCGGKYSTIEMQCC